MTPRPTPASRLVRSLLPMLILLLAGCDQGKEQGPVAIHWDRDTCERCKMLISDRRFAAELRDPENKPHLFDDVGDLVIWLHERQWLDRPLAIYVADLDNGTWLNGREARYTAGHTSPMGHGFAAHAASRANDMDFATMAARVITAERQVNPALPPYPPSPPPAATPAKP